MAASDSDEEEQEQQSSSGDDDEDGSSSSDGSDASSSSDEANSDSDDASGGGDDDDDDDEDEDELKQARVRNDIQEMRLMVAEMEKIKQRLLFRLEREKQAKLEEASWQLQQQQQRQRLANEEAQRQQQKEATDAAEKLRQESKVAREPAAQQQQQSSPARSFVEIGVQTEVSIMSAGHEERMSHDAAEQALKSPSTSTQRRTGSDSKQASVPTEGQSARLSLYDLGKSYGMQEPDASPKPKRESHRQHQQQRSYGSAPAPPVSRSRNAPATAVSEASDSDTFFIRRDSNRTNWQPDLANHDDSFRRSQGSVLDSEFDGSEDEHIGGSPTSRTDARTSKSAFQTLRNSILSSIHEGASDSAVRSASAASIESSKLFPSQRSRFNRSNLLSGDGDDAVKTDEQREQEAIQSLLFGR